MNTAQPLLRSILQFYRKGSSRKDSLIDFQLFAGNDCDARKVSPESCQTKSVLFACKGHPRC
uniref:Uncharacterized protein n=1 Tax=Anguilla anguilla TaxID=7936 RepID=A0A0E9RNA2_ANGAN